MKVLLVNNGLNPDSAKLANSYAAWKHGTKLPSGDVITIVQQTVMPKVGKTIPSNWGDLSSNSLQTYQWFNFMNGPSGAVDISVYDMVILSSHFPIRVYGLNNIADDMQSTITNALAGTLASFDYFFSKMYANGVPTFRLDGSIIYSELDKWIKQISGYQHDPARVWLIDSDPGIQYQYENDKYIATARWLDENGYPFELDETPTQPILFANEKYAGYLGWYDAYPNNYFKIGDWTGAVGWHLRSATFRNHEPGSANWVTEPIKAGFAFVVGSTSEPGLVYPDPSKFIKRVLEDREPVGLAAYGGSTMVNNLCFVGDPLWVIGNSQPVEPPAELPTEVVDHEYELKSGEMLRLVRRNRL